MDYSSAVKADGLLLEAFGQVLPTDGAAIVSSAHYNKFIAQSEFRSVRAFKKLFVRFKKNFNKNDDEMQSHVFFPSTRNLKAPDTNTCTSKMFIKHFDNFAMATTETSTNTFRCGEKRLQMW